MTTRWWQKLNSLITSNKNKVSNLQSFGQFGRRSKQWWGTFQVEAGQSRFWRIGNIIICVDRFTNQWHLASCPVTNLGKLPDDDNLSSNFAIPYEELHFKTYTFRTQAEISLKPVLANRPLASKLERPIYIPGGEEILLYVSSPVWVRIETGKSKIILDEIPTFVLSDTWVGENTLEGEICYAGHTHCSPHLSDIPSGPDRIISPMLISNNSKEMLMLQNISVPLPHLSVYSDAEFFLWTEQLLVLRMGDDTPEIKLDYKTPPKAIESIKLLTPARKDSYGAKRFYFNNLIRTKDNID